jgi:tRNA pseudouridine38-40 synthase
MRWALGLQYDGAAFCGWQTQAHAGAVQDALEDALQRFVQRPVATICAGRTDAGVHASYQVVHFDVAVERPSEAWVRGVNTFLPPSVAVRWACPVDNSFHARFAARRRRYDYWLLCDPVRVPLLERRTGWTFRPLDVAAMRQAAQLLIGTHDFSAFRSAQCQAASPVRDLQVFELAEFGRLLRFRLQANAFLHHMVRNLVGTLVYVGMGRQPPQWAAEVLAGRDRRRAAPTFSAAGLYLTGVDYDAAFNLPPPEDLCLVA